MNARRWLRLLALGAFLAACRNPQDPSNAPLGNPDGGPTPPPEVQPDTGRPIGPIAADGSQLPLAPTPSVGGAGPGPGPGSGGVGGFAGGAGMPNRPVVGRVTVPEILVLAERG